MVVHHCSSNQHILNDSKCLGNLWFFVGLDYCLLDNILRGREKNCMNLTSTKFKIRIKPIHALAGLVSLESYNGPILPSLSYTTSHLVQIIRTSYLMQIEFHIPHVNDYVSCQLSCDISETRHRFWVNTKHRMLIRT